MRVVIQRVQRASVTIEGKVKSEIASGLLILAGFEESDTTDDIERLASKISKLRIFDDSKGVMNCSIMEVNGSILIVSQFTLHALTRKGNRPSYIKAARPEVAIPLYESFIKAIEQETGKCPKTGEFGADMKIELINDGPVTLFIDSKSWE